MTTRIICCLILVSFTGCSMLTKQGRQQRSYEKYVRKSSLARYKKAVKFRMSKNDIPLRQGPSDPVMNTSVSESPQSVSAGNSSPSQ